MPKYKTLKSILPMYLNAKANVLGRLNNTVKCVSSVNTRQMDSAPRTATQRLTEVWNSDVQHEQTPIIVQNEGFSNKTRS